MGSRGLPSRKKRQRVKRSESIEGIKSTSLPPVMWPSSGSGFEADPFSPAGMAQQQWTIINSGGKGPGRRILVWAILIVIALGLLTNLLVFFR
jgi:hypothetical protein